MFEVSELIPVKEFLEDEKNNPKKKKFKNDSERKKYIKEVLKIPLVKNPANNKDCVAVANKTVMLSGQRLSATRTKEQEFDDRAEAREAMTKAAAQYDVETTTQARPGAIDTAVGRNNDSSDSSTDDSSASDNDSSKSSFGGRLRDSPVQKKKRRAAKAAAKPNGAAPSATPGSKRRRGGSSAAESKKAANRESLISQAQKLLESLKELSPDVVWRSVIRAAELDRRLTKVPSLLDELDVLAGDMDAPEDMKAQAGELHVAISKKSEEVTGVKELSRILRFMPLADLAADLDKPDGQLLKALEACVDSLLQCPVALPDIIQFIAKKLVDAARLQRRNADSKAFFTFLQAANSDGKFNLAYLYGKALEGDNIAAIVALIRAQITAVGDVFFEKLRAVSGSADFAERILPCELKTAEFDQDDLWLPAPNKITTMEDVRKCSNKSGFASPVMMDLQRVFACLDVKNGVKNELFLGLVTNPKTARFSQRILVPMAANKETLWQQLLAAAKEMGDIKEHQTTAVKLQSLIKDLMAVNSVKGESELGDIAAKVKELQAWPTVVRVLEESGVPEQQATAADLKASIAALDEHASKIFSDAKKVMGQITTWANNGFKVSGDATLAAYGKLFMSGPAAAPVLPPVINQQFRLWSCWAAVCQVVSFGL
ncbi:unnamed protein product [Effrenium voratum]|nr:unnamed protein product [Effrenium voratum]